MSGEPKPDLLEQVFGPRAAGEDQAYPLPDHPARDYLDALDSSAREVRFRLTGPRLLRKAATGQSKTMAQLRRSYAEQAREQMKKQGKRAFRSAVSVEIDLHALGERQPASSPLAVKGYLDLLEGIAYPNDRAVEHLRVTRHARDNPLFTNDWPTQIFGPTPRLPHGPRDEVEVRMVLRPRRLYAADFDRVFAARDEIVERQDSGDRLMGHEFFTEGWNDIKDDERLSDLLEEQREDEQGLGPYSPGGPFAEAAEMRATMREHREREIRGLRRALVLDQRFDHLDRPGPLPKHAQWMQQRWPRYLDQMRRDFLFPGSLLLPAPGLSGWSRDLRKLMREHRGGWRVQVPSDTPLALDIAVRGADDERRDLDNIARDVVASFEEIFCENRRGTVVSYRAYFVEGGEPGLRLLVMGDERLDSFEQLLSAVREQVVSSGPPAD